MSRIRHLKRRRPIPDIDARNPSRRSLAERMAINSVVQGSAADLIKLAMIDLHRLIRSAPLSPRERAGVRGPATSTDTSSATLTNTRMLLQIHDELVFETPEPDAEAAREIIVDRMEHAMDLRVPIKVDSGVSRNWFEAK